MARSKSRSKSCTRSGSGTMKFYCVGGKHAVSVKPTGQFTRSNSRNKVKTCFMTAKCPRHGYKLCKIVSAHSVKRSSGKKSSGRKRSSRKH